MKRRGGFTPGFTPGFTLIEVLIVLAILMALVAIGYPNYAGYITKTRRIEGQVALIEAMQQEERYYTRNNRYLAFSSTSLDPEERHFKWWSGSSAATSAYEIEANACPGQAITQCVELKATPGTEKVDTKFHDSECAVLTLNSAGEQTASGSSNRCWP
jgi:type IV pilus assembly protein PilE